MLTDHCAVRTGSLAETDYVFSLKFLLLDYTDVARVAFWSISVSKEEKIECLDFLENY
jgi:hypothetical protein